LVLLISVLLLLLRGDFDCHLRKIVDKESAGKRESVKMNSSVETESGWRAGPRKQEEDHDGNEAEEEQQQQQQQEEEEEQEEELDSTILQVSLHPAPFVRIHKMSFPELCRTFSAVAWCAKTNLICCAVETCTSDQGSSSEPAFWIPVHVVDPERPTEHSIFNVPAGIYRSQSVQMLLSFLWFQLLFNLCHRTVQWCFSWIFSTCLLQETLNSQWPRVKSIPTTTSKFV
jgi:hypothetical protein